MQPTPPDSPFDIRRADSICPQATGPALAPSADPLWIWPGRLRRGQVSLLAGEIASGKSFLACDLAARLSAGLPFPEAPPDSPPAVPVDVLMIVGPDAEPDLLHDRLTSLQGDLRRIHILRHLHPTAEGSDPLDRHFDLDRDLGSLVSHLQSHPEIQLVILDSFDRLAGPRTSTGATRRTLQRLQTAARTTGVSVLLTKNYVRAPTPGKHLRCLGSPALADSLTAIWAIVQPAREGAAEAAAPTHRLVPLKLTCCETTTSYDFTLQSGRLNWLGRPQAGPTHHHGTERAPRPGQDELSAMEEAGLFLQTLLAEGPLSSLQIRESSRQAGIAWRTLQRAKSKLGVVAHSARRGEPQSWSWWLPGTPETRLAEPSRESPFRDSPAGDSPAGESHTRESPAGERAPERPPEGHAKSPARGDRSGRKVVRLGAEGAPETPEEAEIEQWFMRAAERGYAKINNRMVYVGVDQAIECLNLIGNLPSRRRWAEAISPAMPTPHLVAWAALSQLETRSDSPESHDPADSTEAAVGSEPFPADREWDTSPTATEAPVDARGLSGEMLRTASASNRETAPPVPVDLPAGRAVHREGSDGEAGPAAEAQMPARAAASRRRQEVPRSSPPAIQTPGPSDWQPGESDDDQSNQRDRHLLARSR